MSRATNQSLTLLAGVSGCMKIAISLKNAENALHFRFMEPYFNEALKQSNNCIYKWDCSGDEIKNALKIIKFMEYWNTYLIDVNAQLTPLILTNVALQSISDLHTVINDPRKIALLDTVFPPLQKVSDYLDRSGDMIDQYRYTEELLDVLYKHTGFYNALHYQKRKKKRCLTA